MATIRKLTADEIRAMEERARRASQRGAPRVRVTEEPPPAYDDAHFTTRSQPRIGDIVRIYDSEDTRGIVVRVHARDNGWLAAEVLCGANLRWFSSRQIGSVIGRPRGISRIDQPRRRTHGWFVRLYEGSATRLARMFSDQKHQGIGRALQAALEFHANHDQRAQLTERSVG